MLYNNNISYIFVTIIVVVIFIMINNPGACELIYLCV